MSSGFVLSGPPGAGKSTVGRAVAEHLGLSCLDLDDLIHERMHMTAAEIIRTEGETRFRQIEQQVLSTLPPMSHVVVLGGGTLTTAQARKEARMLGPVLHLQAEVDTLLDRLKMSGQDRPLLDGDEPALALGRLLEKRRLAYASVDQVVPAGGNVPEVVDRVVAEARRLSVLRADVGDQSTRILIGHGLSQAVVGAVADKDPARPVLTIVDEGVPTALRAHFVDRLSKSFDVVLVPVPGGEVVKSWESLGKVLDTALTAGCGRQSVVVGIGGGATCDLAGMVAALLGRGAPLVLVPTTLLAQVDASVGGKCAVNMAAGRNLAGTFHAARDVVLDLEFLATLSAEEYRSGMAELAKMGAIADRDLFLSLVSGRTATLELIAAAVQHKATIVRSDPFEQGPRKLLNFGHTLGHALESASDYRLRHGEAVAIGMAAVTRLCRSRSWISEAEADILLRGLAELGLPVVAEPELLNRSKAFLRNDKKADQSAVDLVALRGLGKAEIVRLCWSEVEDDLVRCGGSR